MNMIWFKSNCWSNFSWIMHFLGWQIKCLKDPCIKNGPIWASSKNLPFFLDVTSKLFQHISGFSDVKYQMTWCIEHEKYPNCVRLCTIVSVIDDLLVTVDRNTLYIHRHNIRSRFCFKDQHPNFKVETTGLNDCLANSLLNCERAG